MKNSKKYYKHAHKEDNSRNIPNNIQKMKEDDKLGEEESSKHHN